MFHDDHDDDGGGDDDDDDEVNGDEEEEEEEEEEEGALVLVDLNVFSAIFIPIIRGVLDALDPNAFMTCSDCLNPDDWDDSDFTIPAAAVVVVVVAGDFAISKPLALSMLCRWTSWGATMTEIWLELTSNSLEYLTAFRVSLSSWLGERGRNTFSLTVRAIDMISISSGAPFPLCHVAISPTITIIGECALFALWILASPLERPTPR